jgi:hypothetical protein
MEFVASTARGGETVKKERRQEYPPLDFGFHCTDVNGIPGKTGSGLSGKRFPPARRTFQGIFSLLAIGGCENISGRDATLRRPRAVQARNRAAC